MLKNKKVVIIGAGPSGLTAAYELCKARVESVILEKDGIIGGISRTINHNGYLFDIGGHRFFTKVKVVEDFWQEILSSKQFVRRSRLSRIYYNKKFFHYPLRVTNALFGLGILNSLLTVLSYSKARLTPVYPEVTFEDWVSNRFGKRLYQTFFKTYTEKVWGIPCHEISAEWASQRIQGLSLFSAIKNSIIPAANGKNSPIKTLIDSFDYPVKGPGMMWETVAEIVESRGCRTQLNAQVEKIFWDKQGVKSLKISNSDGTEKVVSGSDFISSMPIRELIRKMEPEVPAEITEAAAKLNYRDFLTVAIVINKPDIFQDNWIYIHEPTVKVGRIQNFKNWSPEMVPDQTKTCLGLEYFCTEGDELWKMADEKLIELATKELETLGFISPQDVVDGAVVKMPKAYPVYDSGYADALKTIRDFLRHFPNLYLVGRNGMHKYNNQDHSMLTAMLSVKNILGENHDVWEVNVEQDYHEEINDDYKQQFTLAASTQPLIPKRLEKSAGR